MYFICSSSDKKKGHGYVTLEQYMEAAKTYEEEMLLRNVERQLRTPNPEMDSILHKEYIHRSMTAASGRNNPINKTDCQRQ